MRRLIVLCAALLCSVSLVSACAPIHHPEPPHRVIRPAPAPGHHVGRPAPPPAYHGDFGPHRPAPRPAPRPHHW